MITPRIASFKIDVAVAKGQIVKLGSSKRHVTPCSATTDRAIGIAASAGTTLGDTIEVYLPGGGGKVLVTDTVAKGKFIVATTDGSGIKAGTAGDVVIAQAMDDAVTGDIVECNVVLFQAYNAQS